MASSRRISIQQISLEAVLDVEDALQGFYAVGIKQKGTKGKKIGFILSGVRLISFQDDTARTRIKWLPAKGFEVRDEVYTQMGSRTPSSVFFVGFDDWSRPVVVQGEPDLSGDSFQSQTVHIDWNEEGNIQLRLPSKMRSNYMYTCSLNQRLRTIECVVG